MAGLLRDDLPEVELSEQRMLNVLVDIKRNSRNRRIAMVAPLALAAAVLAAMIAAPPRHGGLLVADADAEAADPQLPRVFGTNGVWQLAVPIDDDPVGDLGPASVIEAPTEPAAPSFTLSPPDQEELQSLPASTSTPPMSTSGQSQDEPVDPADLDWSAFEAVIRIEPVDSVDTEPVDTTDADLLPAPDPQPVAEESTTTDSDSSAVVVTDESAQGEAPADALTDASTSAVPESDDTDTPSSDGDVTVAAVETLPQDEIDSAEANPSMPLAASAEQEALPFSTPATILPQSVLVYSAHVSVTVQVVDDDSSVVDWCNTRVDWGDGSVTRVVGVDESALCTAPCEHEAETSTSGTSDDTIDGSVETISESIQFEHNYTEVIDASPRIFVATGDGCSYTLAELQLAPFTVVPLG